MDQFCIAKAQVFEIMLDFFRRPRRNFIDHAPRESDFLRIIDIIDEAFVSNAIGCPFISKGQDGFFDFVAIVRAVVEAQKGEGIGACLIAGIGQGSDAAHGTSRLFRSLLHIFGHSREEVACIILQFIAFFSNREAGNL